MAVATTLLCGATLGGSAILSGDSESISPSSVSSSSQHFPTYQGSSASATRATSAMATAVPRVNAAYSGAFASSSAASASASSSSSASSSTSGSMPLAHTGFSGSGSAGSGSGSGGASGATSSSGSGVSSVAGVPVMALASIGASAPQRVTSPRQSSAGGGQNGSTSPSGGLYTGDAPGVIYGNSTELLNLDDAIISCYGLPIGDGVWPLLLLVLTYSLYIFVGKLYRQK